MESNGPTHEDLEAVKDHLELKIQHFQSMLDAHVSRHESEHILLEKYGEISREDMNRRLEAMNNFRAQLERRENMFLSRAEYTAAHDPMVVELHRLVSSQVEIRATMLTAEDLERHKKDEATKSQSIDTRLLELDRTIWRAMGAAAVGSILAGALLSASLAHWFKFL